MALKYLHINEKHHKKQLLISHQQVVTFKNFLAELLRDEVLIINTNLGLEIYYESSYDCTQLIKDTFAIVACKKCKTEDRYRFFSFQNEREIQRFMNASMQKLAGMPLFKSYTKSMLSQLNQQFESNKKLIGRLLQIWHEVSRDTHFKKTTSTKIQSFKKDFQVIYINNVENDILKELFLEMLEPKHLN
ncbi:hypothetical protein [uncultured Kordia sp.]|uniref:hypothetical protein n=1 Tax=uncultured Kordia sp. TaxID=507699 RepID=UPI002631721A|nr:hypothetical protein [uncultured Kordia sp.]